MNFMRKSIPEILLPKSPVAVFGDIHSNLEALSAVLADIRRRGIRRMVCTGDVVGYGASPTQCIDLLRKAGCPVVQGNHDFFASTDHPLDEFSSNARRAVLWTREQLSELDLNYLAGLPMTQALNGFSVVHSSLDNPLSWRYVMKPVSADKSFVCQTDPVVFAGHTHVPSAFYREKGLPTQGGRFKKVHIDPVKQWFINPGSVGQPRDGDPRAAYAVFDPRQKLVVLHRVKYNIAESQRKIRESELPEWNAARLSVGK